MSIDAHDILVAFDALGPSDKQQVAVEILRRSAGIDDLTDQTFDEMALEVFRGYDAEESPSADR
jgi:hypothetical protein